MMRHPVFYQVDKAPGMGPGPRLALRLADALVLFLSLSSTHTPTLSLPGMPTEESPNRGSILTWEPAAPISDPSHGDNPWLPGCPSALLTRAEVESGQNIGELCLRPPSRCPVRLFCSELWQEGAPGSPGQRLWGLRSCPCFWGPSADHTLPRAPPP